MEWSREQCVEVGSGIERANASWGLQSCKKKIIMHIEIGANNGFSYDIAESEIVTVWLRRPETLVPVQ